MDHRHLRIRIDSGEYHVQIFLQRGIDGHHRPVLFVGDKIPLFRKQHHHRFVAAQHFHHHALRRVILLRFAVRRLQNQRVRANVHRVAHLHALLHVAVERRPGQPYKYEHHAHMNDVAAIPPRVAHGQVNRTGGKRSPRARADDFRAPVEFEQNGGGHEETQDQACQRIESAESQNETHPAG